VHDHTLKVAGAFYTPTKDLIPSGEIVPVASTPLDFTSERRIGDALEAIPDGLDHNFVCDALIPDLRGKCSQPGAICPVIQVIGFGRG
jgi:galactose mutarotase-like enzyme